MAALYFLNASSRAISLSASAILDLLIAVSSLSSCVLIESSVASLISLMPANLARSAFFCSAASSPIFFSAKSPFSSSMAIRASRRKRVSLS